MRQNPESEGILKFETLLHQVHGFVMLWTVYHEYHKQHLLWPIDFNYLDMFYMFQEGDYE